ncbi:MFS general substrate transporter [Exidia glandulosa HHB12029]|uniref:MFS general substrate transporter n=1 Tax=Exidia glandulosa HHB12029 TaxID=1314781 RepID=A0A165R342_EXIGL|nr:MFS general substrate transporter [Exidia glandulosa HHB12029]
MASVEDERKLEVEQVALRERDSDDDEISYDSGWRAWSTVVGAWLMNFSNMGAVNTFGVYQDFYVREYLTNYSASDIAWIGGMQPFLVLGLGLAVGKPFDMGYFRHLVILGWLLNIFSLFMLSLAKPQQYYAIFLSQGVGVGLGLGCIFLPTHGIIALHFQKKRSLAMGLAFSGASAGSLVLPIMVNHLLHGPLGFANGVRVFASVAAVTQLCGICLMRGKEKRKSTAPPASLLHFFREVHYVFAVAGQFFIFLAIFFPVYYIQLDAIRHGIPSSLAYIIIALMGAASVPGRILPNFLADKLGVINMMLVCGVCSGIMILSMLGIQSSSSAGTSAIVIAIFYGFFSGALFALGPTMMASLARDVHEVGIRCGVGFVFMGIGALLGSPINGWLLGSEYAWWKAIAFSTILMLAGTACLVVPRTVVGRRKNSRYV